MSTLSAVFPKIETSRLDGQAQSFRYKQAALRRLHEALIEAATKLKTSIQADWFISSLEADLELSKTLLELRSLYESLDLQKDIKSIHQIEKGHQNLERTRPLDIVYIKPSKWSLLYSVISPLAAAVAAGCCVVVELPQTLSKVSAVLKEVMTKALSADTFAVSSSTPALEFTRQCFLVNQTDEAVNPLDWLSILSAGPSRGTIAIVDRTANARTAAQAIGAANFEFSGHSMYTPQIVLVNEFVTDTFLEELVTNAAQSSYPTKSQFEDDGSYSDDKGNHPTIGSNRVVFTSPRLTIIEVFDLQKSMFATKPTERTIMVYRISSLDDALNLLRHYQLTASFLFAGLKQANYLSRAIKSAICAVNYIPMDLLVGPVAPMHSFIASKPAPRYVPAMFTLPAPQYLRQDDTPSCMSDLDDHKVVQGLTKRAMDPLTSTGEGDGKRLNFFPQAILVGLSMTILSVVGIGLGGCWFAFKSSRTL